eukprot:7382717-Prymnesium_polylepis.4
MLDASERLKNELSGSIMSLRSVRTSALSRVLSAPYTSMRKGWREHVREQVGCGARTVRHASCSVVQRSGMRGLVMSDCARPLRPDCRVAACTIVQLGVWLSIGWYSAKWCRPPSPCALRFLGVGTSIDMRAERGPAGSLRRIGRGVSLVPRSRCACPCA